MCVKALWGRGGGGWGPALARIVGIGGLGALFWGARGQEGLVIPLSFADAAGGALSHTDLVNWEGKPAPPPTTRMLNDKYFQRNLAQIPKELETFTFTEAVNFAVEKVIA